MKYIFIDSNQYRHLFSINQQFSDDLVELLCKLANNEQIQILMPQQTKDEITRNRWCDWHYSEIKTLESKINGYEKKLEDLQKNYQEFESDYKKLKKAIQSRKSAFEKEKSKLKTKFLSKRSRQNQNLKKLFEACTHIPENESLYEKARLRFDKGNPPYDSKIGDSLIWESILEHINTNSTNRPTLLLIVSNDKKAFGDGSIDPWLEEEFKDKTKGKDITLVHRLSDIPEFTKEEKDKIELEELESIKMTAVEEFCNSESFVSAGDNAKRLLDIQNLLTTDDFKKILEASTTNHEIYRSFFTSTPLYMLLFDETGYLRKEIQEIEQSLWENFCEKFGFQISERPIKSKIENTNITINDIPF